MPYAGGRNGGGGGGGGGSAGWNASDIESSLAPTPGKKSEDRPTSTLRTPHWTTNSTISKRRIDLLGDQADSRRGGVSIAVIVSFVLHALLLAYFIATYKPLSKDAPAPPIARYVELIRQNPDKTFVEAPGPKLDRAPSPNAAFSDAQPQGVHAASDRRAADAASRRRQPDLHASESSGRPAATGHAVAGSSRRRRAAAASRSRRDAAESASAVDAHLSPAGAGQRRRRSGELAQRDQGSGQGRVPRRRTGRPRSQRRRRRREGLRAGRSALVRIVSGSTGAITPRGWSAGFG